MFETQEVLRILEELDSEDEQVCANALKQLKDNPRLIETLGTVLEDTRKDVVLRERAAKALGQYGDALALEPLAVTLFQDENFRIQEAVIQALGHVGDARAGELLLAILMSNTPFRYVRINAIKALGQRKETRAVELLVATLQREDSQVRKAAAQALAQIGDTRAVEPLVLALQNEHLFKKGNSDWRVCVAAAQALGQIGDVRAVRALIEACVNREWFFYSESLEIEKAAMQALEKIGNAAVETLVTFLKDNAGDQADNNFARRQQIRAKHGLPALEVPKKAKNNDRRVALRQAAAKALGQSKDMRAVQALEAVLTDTNEEEALRWSAAKALGQIGRPASATVRTLIQEFNSGDSKVKDKVLSILFFMGPAAMYAVSFLIDKWHEIKDQEHLQRVLRSIGGESAVYELRSRTTDYYLHVKGHESDHVQEHKSESKQNRCCHWTWWIIRPAFPGPFLAGYL